MDREVFADLLLGIGLKKGIKAPLGIGGPIRAEETSNSRLKNEGVPIDFLHALKYDFLYI